jgi:hypothetical protein
MNWSDGKQITIPGKSAAKSDQGPALAASANVIYLAYVGTGGENLYLSYLDIDPKNPSGWQAATWQGNEQVRLSDGTKPEANSRPAIIGGLSVVTPTGPQSGLQLIYTDKKSEQVISLFYNGITWSSNGVLTAFPRAQKFSQPVVAVCNFTDASRGGTDVTAIAHLVVLDKSGTPWYSSQRTDVTVTPTGSVVNESPWVAAQQLVVPGLVTNVKDWGLSAVGSTGYLFGFTEHFLYIFNRPSTDSTWAYQATQLVPQDGIKPAAAVGFFGSSALNLIYTPAGNFKLFTASNVAVPGDIVNPAPVTPNAVAALTNKTPAAVPFFGANGAYESLLLAYKGHTSDRLYFAYAT